MELQIVQWEAAVIFRKKNPYVIDTEVEWMFIAPCNGGLTAKVMPLFVWQHASTRAAEGRKGLFSHTVPEYIASW